ncbi:MAG: hypothetical protein QOG15_1433 [Solirubrobacteraceae bacterium]|nr:hypothetical protein [Solirubrobacteraceae bacterium]
MAWDYARRVMQDAFKGFLRLRMMGLLVLLLVVAVVLGISSLSRGSTVVGVAIIAGVAVIVAAAGSLAARRASQRPR